MKDSTNATDYNEHDDIRVIRSQCGVSLAEAVELYTKANQDVIQAISLFFDPRLMDSKKQKPINKTQNALNHLRIIANEKDKMFSEFLTKNKPTHPQHEGKQTAHQESIIEPDKTQSVTSQNISDTLE